MPLALDILNPECQEIFRNLTAKILSSVQQILCLSIGEIQNMSAVIPRSDTNDKQSLEFKHTFSLTVKEISNSYVMLVPGRRVCRFLRTETQLEVLFVHIVLWQNV